MDFRSFLVNLLKVPSRVLRSVFLNRADRQHSSRSQTQKSRRRLSFEEIVNIIRLNNGPEGVDLSNTDLTEVDLSGLDLKGVNFSRSSLRKTSFTRCHLSGADFSFSNCAGADFFRANMALAKLVHTYFRSANFVEASLYRANLTGADFLRADLRRVNLHRANLTDTKLSREALGDRILQESKDDYRDYLKRILSVDRREERVVRQMKWRLHDAEQVYRSLKNLFTSTGQYSDASWAYVRERQSRRKTHHPRNAFQNRQHEIIDDVGLKILYTFKFYLGHLVKWVSDWAAELSCGYGEKPLRPAVWAGIILLLFPFAYSMSGGIVSEAGPMTWLDYFNYSFGAFTTMGFNQFHATTPLAQTLTSIEALLGISILALLMFTLGNRLSRA